MPRAKKAKRIRSKGTGRGRPKKVKRKLGYSGIVVFSKTDKENK